MPRKYDFSDAARERSRNKEATRRERINSLPKSFNREDKDMCLTLFGNACGYCGALETDVALEYDHYIDVFREECPGTVMGNMVPSCRPCNRRKGSKGPESILTPEKQKEVEKLLSTLGGVFQ